MQTKHQLEALRASLAVTGDVIEVMAHVASKMPSELSNTRTLFVLELLEAAHALRRARMHLRPIPETT